MIFLRNGKSGYSILLPQKPGKKELKAAEEIKYCFKEMSGISLKIIFEGDVESGEYISIGRTCLLAQTPYNEHKKGALDALNIYFYNNSIFLVGDDDDGTLNATYEFLEKYFGVRFFAPDETLLPKVKNIIFEEQNIRKVPDFETRMLGYYGAMSDPEFADRRRVLSSHANWGLWSHSHFIILPPEKYLDLHRDWYSSDKTQLCLTNTEMQKEFIKNLFDIIESNPTAEYFNLGQEDVDTFCDCKNCAESDATFGGASGTMMRFINAVAREIAKLIKLSDIPERKVLLTTFAYCKTEKPPSIHSEQTDTFAPAHPSVIAEENVGVMFAPIFNCFNHDMMNKTCNIKPRNNLLGWGTVSKKLLIWCYSSNFAGYLVPLYNFNTIESTYRTYKKFGVVYIYDQGIFNSPDTFHYLKTYVNSSLLFDTSLSAETLFNEFMPAYYLCAAPDMIAYYNCIRKNYQAKEGDVDFHCYCTWNNGAKTITKDVFSYDFILDCLAYVDSALNKINKEQALINEKLYLRVVRESLFPRYLQLHLYSDRFSKMEIVKLMASLNILLKLPV